jgi:hypothetical protein
MKKIILLSIMTAAFAFANSQTTSVTSSTYTNRASEMVKNADEEEIDVSKLTTKQLEQTVDLPKAIDIIIATTRNLTIRTWKENKVKLETTVRHQGLSELSTEEWMKTLGLDLRLFGSTVKVKNLTSSYALTTTDALSPSYNFVYSSGTTYTSTITSKIGKAGSNEMIFDGNGKQIGTVEGQRKVVLTIPENSLVEMDTKYGNVVVENDLRELIVANNGSNIDAKNLNKLSLRSSNGNLSAQNITTADIEINHGRLKIKSINDGTVTSTYSTAEIETINNLNLNSTSDEIEIDEAKQINGTKNYGSLRINRLTTGINLAGQNSDIKIRNISSSVDLVKISNRNAELRLPVRDLKAYNVEVKGRYNNLLAGFVQDMLEDSLSTKEVKEMEEASITNPKKVIAMSGQGVSKTKTRPAESRSISTAGAYPILLDRYETAAGVYQLPLNKVLGNNLSANIKYSYKTGDGKTPKFEIKCISCTIDFK